MIVKLKELLESEKVLAELLQQPLPIKVAYHLGKLVNKVGSELKEFYNTRDNLIKKYGKPGENEGEFGIAPDDTEAIAKFTKDLNELVDVDVDLYNFQPIPINELINTDVKLTAVQMNALEAFFTE